MYVRNVMAVVSVIIFSFLSCSNARANDAFGHYAGCGHSLEDFKRYYAEIRANPGDIPQSAFGHYAGCGHSLEDFKRYYAEIKANPGNLN
jgi:hypothetical protein